MRKALITTTINVPHNLVEWSSYALNMDTDHIFIAGDFRTPRDAVRKFIDHLYLKTGVRSTYIGVEDDDRRDFYTTDAVGYNCIQRRNVALLAALSDTNNYELIITVDDDNYPVGVEWGRDVESIFNCDLNDEPGICRMATTSRWYNVGHACDPPVVHRGYPINERHTSVNLIPNVDTCGRVGVFASLWLGDPDIDAIERIVNDPNVEYVNETVSLADGTWCPFNSQATVYHRDVAPLMYMWPGVGRMDDIWSSLTARAIMDPLGYRVVCGHPLVRQDRNQHDLIKDMQAEMLGYQFTPQLAEKLRAISEMIRTECTKRAVTPYEALHYAFDTLSFNCTFLNDKTRFGFTSWLRDLREMGIK